MSTDERIFLRELKKWLFGSLFGVIVLSVGFYFTTLNRLSNLEHNQEKLEIHKADKEVIQTELNNLNKSVDRIERKIDEIKKM